MARERIGDIAAAIDISFGSARAATAQAEVWPGGIAVLGVVPDAGLLALQADLGAALRSLHCAIDARPWRPHITIARYAQSASPSGLRPPTTWPVTGFALMESVGGRHDVVRRYSGGDGALI